MVQPISNSTALHTAQQAMKRTMKELDAIAEKVATEEINAENMVKLEVAKKNVQAQKVSMEAALQSAQQVIDILAK